MTYNKLLNKYIEEQQVARRLMLHHTKLSSVELFQKLDDEADFSIETFESDMNKYIAGEPLQYIVGFEYFADLKIRVQPGVYIPRPETEMLVYEVIDIVKENFGNAKLIIADICSGSGAIALALNKHLQNKTYGLELSEIALEQAIRNNKFNNCNVQFVKSDIDRYLIDNNIKLDVLVSNPPYIKPSLELEKRVQNHEPHMALFDDEADGMSFYRQILSNHTKITKKNSIIAFELGFDQKDLMEELIIKTFGKIEYYFLYDYEDNARAVIIKKI